MKLIKYINSLKYFNKLFQFQMASYCQQKQTQGTINKFTINNQMLDIERTSIYAQIEAIKKDNLISITEKMEGFYHYKRNLQPINQVLQPQILQPSSSISHQIETTNQKKIGFQQQQERANNLRNEWVPYLQILAQSHDKKVKQINQLISYVESLFSQIAIDQQQKKEFAHQQNLNIQKLHEYETWYQKDRQEIQMLQERLEMREREFQEIYNLKQYWEEQFNLQKREKQKEISYEQILGKDQSLTGQDSLNLVGKRGNQIDNQQKNKFQQDIQILNIKLIEAEKLIQNLRIANKILEKELIKMGEEYMKIQIQYDELRNENQMLAQEIQDLYNDNLSKSYSYREKEIQQQNNQHQNINCHKIFEEDEKEQQELNYNVFEKTRALMMFQDGTVKGNNISDELYKIKSLSVSSSIESLLSMKQQFQIQKNDPQTFQKQNNQQLFEAKKKQSQLGSDIPTLNLKFTSENKKNIKIENNFMKKSIIQTLQTNQASDNKLNQIVRGIVLKRIGKNIVKRPQKQEQTPKKSLTQRLAQNSWTQKLVTKRIRGKSPNPKRNEQRSSQIMSPICQESKLLNQKTVQKQIRLKQIQSFCELEKNAQMTKSMLVQPTQNKQLKTDEMKSSFMNFLVGAVVKNRIKK